MKTVIHSVFPSLFAAVVSTLVCSLAAVAEPVVTIDAVTPTQQPYPMTAILANVATDIGQEFNPQVLSQDIERLYKTGFFKYVDSRVTDVEGGKSVRFIVEPFPRVRTIAFEGNELISDRRLRRTVATSEGDLFSPTKASADLRDILQLYQRRGYHRTTVELVERDVPAEPAVDLVWRIGEEPRYKIRDIAFVGNTVYSDRQLRRAMATKRNPFNRLFRVGFYNERTVEADRYTLRELYDEKGHLDARFDLRETIAEDGKWISLTVDIDEGVAYRVEQVDFAGNNLFGDDELRAATRLAPGETFSLGTQRADVERIANLYRPLGYLQMQGRGLLDKNVDAATVVVTYHIQEGVASTIRDITISGNHETKDKVIRRELYIQAGDLADLNRINRSRNALQSLGYFQSVEIGARSVGDDPTLTDLDINVVEGPTGSFTFGGGFSDSDGFMLTGEVVKSNFDLHRFFTTWPPKAGGGGQRVRLTLSAGSERDEFTFSFIEPWFMDRRLRLETGIFHHSRYYSHYDQTNTGAEVMLTRELSNHPWWRQSFGLRVDHVRIGGVDDDPPIFIGPLPFFPNQEMLDEEGNYWSNSLIYGMRRETRDSFLNPTKGSRVDLRLRLAPQAMGSYSDVYQVDLGGTKYLPLNQNDTLRLFAKVGVVDKLSGDNVAIFDRYFAGGAGTIRGFKWRDVGPVDGNEDPLGGGTIFLGSVEYIHVFRRVSDNLRGSVFCDFGNVWNGAYDFDGDLNASVGLGIEINLPVGRGRIPIRFDYGWPIATQQDHLGGNGRFHFNFGYHY